MPELPEVQTIVDELSKKIIGKKITDVWGDWPKTFRQAGGLNNFKKEVKNKKIVSVRRRAKYVIVDIEGPKTIVIHQKISGHLLYGKWEKTKSVKQKVKNKEKFQTWTSAIPGPLKDDSRNYYIRVIFFLNNGYQIGFSDLRRFGKIMFVDDGKVDQLKEIKELGPEPLEIKFKEFEGLFKRKKGKLKQVLMNPAFIAGIGNIYGDEILWDACLHPLSRTENLKTKELKKLFISVNRILKKAIKYKGDSIDDYRLPSGKKGKYQEVQYAYQQTGKKCKKNDGGIIERIKINGRSAHFCPTHQKRI